MSDLPLVSFCMKSFNQKEYFRLALKAAFAQTYENLEIVISDNHSTDGSDEMIREMVDAYKASGGRHKIVYKYNEENIGLVRNSEQMVLLSHGELCIQADGDDISFPDRTKIIVDAWLKSGRTISVISSERVEIDPEGRPIGIHPSDPPLCGLGCSLAFVPAVVKNFPPLGPAATIDDKMFCFRGLLLGDYLGIKQPLLAYRVGNTFSTSIVHPRKARMGSIRGVLSEIHLMREALSNCETMDEDRRMYISGLVDRLERRYKLEDLLVNGRSMIARARAFINYCDLINVKKTAPSYWLFYMPMVLPHCIGDFITNVFYWLKYKQKVARSRNIISKNGQVMYWQK